MDNSFLEIEIDTSDYIDKPDFEDIDIPHCVIKNTLINIITEKNLDFLLNYIRVDIDEILVSPTDEYAHKLQQIQKFYLDSTPVENRHGRTLGNYTESVGAIFLLMFNLDLYNLEESNDELIFQLMQYIMTSCNLYKNKLPVDMMSSFIIPDKDTHSFIPVTEDMIKHLLTRTNKQPHDKCVISNKYNKYETKYLKYKTKYLKLKKLKIKQNI